MLSYEEARSRILGAVRPLSAETVPLRSAHGRFLAEPVSARLSQPPFAASAMDGWAIRWKDMPGPWRGIGESAAGSPFEGRVEAGEAVRIFTGAPLPGGADTVVVQEDIDASGSDIRLRGDGPSGRGTHVRPAGNDFSEGRELAPNGAYASAALLGLAASAGHDRLSVHKRPRIALISTGDELVSPGAQPGPAQIIASGGPMIAARLRSAGAEIAAEDIVPDRLDELSARLRQAAEADIVITIGGASVGDRDLVRQALDDAGAAVDFWKIAIKPGKPLIAGTLGSARFIGLPGNPVSAFVCTLLFAEPLVRHMLGDSADSPVMHTARLAAPLAANGNRRDHLRARFEDGCVKAFTGQDSAQLRILAAADALIVREPGAKALETGDLVPIIRLDAPSCFP